jgi:hypothetical protein
MAVTLVFLGVPVARASGPDPAWCLGESVSSFSKANARPGSVYRAFAQDPQTEPGLGDGVQGLQAGLVPDADFPNTCNG